MAAPLEITASLVARQSRKDDGSLSVPDQIAAMRAWAERQDPPVRVVAVYEEPDVSGRRPLAKRKGLLRAVEDVEAGRSKMVVTAYFDRMARSVAVRAEALARIEGKGGEMMTLDAGKTSDAEPVSKFTGVVMMAAAELMAEQAGVKSAASKQRNIDRGVPPFPGITPAYRRRADKTLEQDPVNAPIVKEAIRMRLEDGTSYPDLARWFGQQGIDLTTNGVSKMFQSRLLIGELHFGKFRPNLHAIKDPLIDRKTFDRLGKKRVSAGRRPKAPRLLARMDVLVCGSCDAYLAVNGNGNGYNAYYCGDPRCTARAAIRAEVAEDFIRDKALEAVAGMKGRASAKAELEAARLAAVEDAEALDALIDMLTGLGDRPSAKAKLADAQTKAEASQAHYERLLAVTSPDLVIDSLDAWNRASLDRRRELIRATIARAVVAHGRGPDRIEVDPK